MTGIFISHTKENGACAEQLQQGLAAEGYTVWSESSAISPLSPLDIRTIENNILRSAAAILVWSSSAAQSQWSTQHLLFAQSLKKPLFLVVPDGTLLPDTVITVQSIQSDASCMNAVGQLVPLLPPAQSKNVSRLGSELEKITRHKMFWLRVGGIIFGLGSLTLAALIISIIWAV